MLNGSGEGSVSSFRKDEVVPSGEIDQEAGPVIATPDPLLACQEAEHAAMFSSNGEGHLVGKCRNTPTVQAGE